MQGKSGSGTALRHRSSNISIDEFEESKCGNFKDNQQGKTLEDKVAAASIELSSSEQENVYGIAGAFASIFELCFAPESTMKSEVTGSENEDSAQSQDTSKNLQDSITQAYRQMIYKSQQSPIPSAKAPQESRLTLLSQMVSKLQDDFTQEILQSNVPESIHVNPSQLQSNSDSNLHASDIPTCKGVKENKKRRVAVKGESTCLATFEQ